MYQDYISKHTFPHNQSMLLTATMLAEYAPNGSTEPNSNCHHVNFTNPTGEEYYYYFQPVIIDGGPSKHIDHVIGVSGSVFYYGSVLPFIVHQERPRGSSGIDHYLPMAIYPVQVNLGPNSMTFKDAVSVPPPQDPNNVVFTGLLWLFKGESHINGYSGTTHVIKDGAVFQPNK